MMMMMIIFILTNPLDFHLPTREKIAPPQTTLELAHNLVTPNVLCDRNLVVTNLVPPL